MQFACILITCFQILFYYIFGKCIQIVRLSLKLFIRIFLIIH